MKLVPVNQQASVFFIHADQIDTPRIVQDSQYRNRWAWDPDGFGQLPPNENPAGLGAFVFNLRMPGQYFDAESGLFYNHFRDYDPQSGRYVESDPIGLAGGTNTYSYVNGNPVDATDPLGLASTKIDGDRIQVHKKDVDPWPSDPHGHIYDKNQVVDKDGNIYDKSSKKKIGQLGKRALAKWLDFLKKIEGKMCLPLMIQDLLKAYCEENPVDDACRIVSPPDPDDPCAGVPFCT